MQRARLVPADGKMVNQFAVSIENGRSRLEKPDDIATVGLVRSERRIVRKIPSAFDESDDGKTVLESVAERLGWRERIRARPLLGWIYRVLVAVLGGLIVVVGLIMVPMPGPGWLIVFAGMGLLATEFAWAQRVLRFGREKLHQWTYWAKQQSLRVRLLIGLAGLLVLGGLAVAALHSVGWNWFPFA